jgi:hypothetical protein
MQCHVSVCGIVVLHVHAIEQDGRTALDVAKQFGKLDMVRLLEVCTNADRFHRSIIVSVPTAARFPVVHLSL